MLGGVFLIGLATDLAARHSPIPRVTLLLLAGFLVGPSVLDLLPDFSQAWFPILTDIALVMIGFLLGQKVTLSALRERGKPVLVMSVAEVLATSTLVLVVLLALGVRTEIALLLAGVAPASAPAATVDVVHELRAEGKFTETLLGIVAVDDAWGLLMFSIMLAVAQGLGGEGSASEVLLTGLWEVGGALVVGIAIGLPMALMTGRLEKGEPTQAEALGLVLLCGGISVWLDVSYILAAMVLGATVASRANHHRRPFRAIEGIEWPFMILFFVLSGASLHIGSLLEAGALGAAYVVLRASGLISGAWLGGRVADVDPVVRRWVGTALLPQAGVALGMALLAAQQFPELKDTIIPVVIGSTVVFEIVGPMVIRRAVEAAGEARAAE
jgi:Kef-type K+ transport system membrane component KefB